MNLSAITPFGFRWVLSCAIVLMVGGELQAQTLPAATVTLRCNLDGDEEERIDYGGTVFTRADSAVFDGACDKEVSGTDFEFSEIADAFAISGPEPEVITRTTTKARVFPEAGSPPDCEIQSDAFIDAGAAMRFSVAVNERTRPQFRPASIPTRILILGQLDVRVDAPNSGQPGENIAFAAAQFAGADGTILFMRDRSTQSGTIVLPFSESIPKDFLINDDVEGDYAVEQFEKTAFSQVSSNVRGPCTAEDKTEAFARALIDPVFVFDQERFDETHGANSFPLEDFFTISASANLFDLLFDSGFEAFDSL